MTLQINLAGQKFQDGRKQGKNRSELNIVGIFVFFLASLKSGNVYVSRKM